MLHSKQRQQLLMHRRTAAYSRRRVQAQRALIGAGQEGLQLACTRASRTPFQTAAQ